MLPLRTEITKSHKFFRSAFRRGLAKYYYNFRFAKEQPENYQLYRITEDGHTVEFKLVNGFSLYYETKHEG